MSKKQIAAAAAALLTAIAGVLSQCSDDSPLSAPSAPPAASADAGAP